MKRDPAASHRAERPLPGLSAGAELELVESLTLRQLLLELRPDLPPEQGRAGELDRARFAEALVALGELAVAADAVEPLLEAACARVQEALGVDGVALLREWPDGERVEVRVANGALADAVGELLEVGEGTQVGFALSSRGATATADARAAWMGDRFLAAHGLVAAALAPLPGAGRPRHLLGAYAQGRRAFAPDEVHFLEAAAGTLSAALARCRGDAERAELRDRLTVADRMASVGTLAAGVAHELNNPLSYVTANIAYLVEQLGELSALLPTSVREDEEARYLLSEATAAAAEARDGVERMRVIVRDLKALSRGDDGKLGPVELAPVLESCVNVAWNGMKHRARLVRDLQPVPPVLGCPTRLNQVFLNLLVNATQAVPEGHPDDHQIRVSARPLDEDRVAVEISDTGCGIPPEVLPRIFEPFFTTKAPGEGTGLGLSIVKGLVSGMGGEVQVESVPGRGATFRVVLPAAGPIPVPVQPGAAGEGTAPDASPRRARILVVDDEPFVVMVLERSLGGEHDIATCSSAQEVLDRLERGETYDLIFSDLLMPGLTGMDLHRELQRRHPAMAERVVFLTGGACSESARRFLAQPGMEWLEKPFDLASLREVIARRARPDAAAA